MARNAVKSFKCYMGKITHRPLKGAVKHPKLRKNSIKWQEMLPNA